MKTSLKLLLRVLPWLLLVLLLDAYVFAIRPAQIGVYLNNVAKIGTGAVLGYLLDVHLNRYVWPHFDEDDFKNTRSITMARMAIRLGYVAVCVYAMGSIG